MLVAVNVNNKVITICWIAFHKTGVQRSLLKKYTYILRTQYSGHWLGNMTFHEPCLNVFRNCVGYQCLMPLRVIYRSGINTTVIKYWERTASDAECSNDMAMCLVSTRYLIVLFGTLLQSTYLSLFLEQFYRKNYTEQRELRMAISNQIHAPVTERGCINHRNWYAGRDGMLPITRKDKCKIILKRRLCPD